MAQASLESATELEQVIMGVLDRLGLTLPNNGLKDGSVADEKLASSFLKLLAGGSAQVASGASSATFPSSTVTNDVVIPHGLPGVPIYVGVAGTDLNTCWWGHQKDATNITVRGSYSSALATTMGFEWVAIG